MLQDLYPHIYHNEISWRAPAPDDLALVFAEDHTVLCRMDGETPALPRIADIPGAWQYAFSIDDRAYYLVDAQPPLPAPAGFLYQKTAALRANAEHPSPALFAVAAGESLFRWYSAQRFCGHCGAKLIKPEPPKEEEPAEETEQTETSESPEAAEAAEEKHEVLEGEVIDADKTEE